MISTRNARSDDALAIAKVQIRSWIDTYTGLLPPVVLEDLDLEQARERFLEAIEEKPEERVYVSEEDGLISGFAIAGPCKDPDSDAVGEVYALYILRDHQGMGIGTQLFLKAVDDLVREGFRSLMVRVLSGNPYCRFYEKHGGKVSETRDEEICGRPVKLRIFRWDSIPLGDSEVQV